MRPECLNAQDHPSEAEPDARKAGMSEAGAAVPPERLTPMDVLAWASLAIWSAGAGLSHGIGVWAGVGGAAIGLGIAALLLARPILAPLLRPSARLLAAGTAAAAVMVAVTYGLYPWLCHHSVAFARTVGGLYAIFRTAQLRGSVGMLLPLMIVAEELIWRGVVQEALSRRFSSVLAILLSSLAYAAAHAPVGSPMLIALCLACGLYWSALRAWTGSLIPSLLSHLIWDCLVFLLHPLA